MKIDLCKLFGVEEGEEFKIEHKDYGEFVYTVIDNILWAKSKYATDFSRSSLNINILDDIEDIIKLPKKKQFTDDELCILRNIDKEYKWIAREDRTENILLFGEKPLKNDNKIWVCKEGVCTFFRAFDYIFKCIQWEDEEPVCIDDYVERGVE